METYIKETISKKELPWDIKKIGFVESECKRKGNPNCQGRTSLRLRCPVYGGGY